MSAPLFAWICVAGAVISNVMANLFIKKSVNVLSAYSGPALIQQALTSPWIWAGGVSAVLLLGFYALALKGLDLSITYAAVTSLAVVGITVAASIWFGESLGAAKLVGATLIIVGVIVISRS